MIDERRLLAGFLHLVKIDSESGAEEALAHEVRARLERLGIAAETDRAGNLLAVLPGGVAGAAPVLLSAHLDTVKPGRGVVPRIAEGVITSAGDTILGADNKSTIAALLEAVQSLKEDGARHGRIELAFTTGEEAFCTGAKALDFGRFRARMGYAFDSAAPVGHVVASGPGHVRIEAVFVGRSAHTGIEPAAGISAIRAAAAAIARMRLGALDERTSANIGTIAGGTGPNIIPERCCLGGEARSCDPAALAAAVEDICAACRAAAAEHGAKCDLTVTPTLKPYRRDPDEPVVELARRAARRVQLPDEVTWTLVGSDVNILNEHGIPAVNLGAALTHAHTTRESLRVSDLVAIARHAEAILLEATGP